MIQHFFLKKKTLVTPSSDGLLKRVKLWASNLPERSPTSVNNIVGFLKKKYLPSNLTDWKSAMFFLLLRLWLIMQQRLSGCLRQIVSCRFSSCSQICVFDETDETFPFQPSSVELLQLFHWGISWRLNPNTAESSKSSHLTNLWSRRGETDVVFFSFLINGTERTKDWCLNKEDL